MRALRPFWVQSEGTKVVLQLSRHWVNGWWSNKEGSAWRSERERPTVCLPGLSTRRRRGLYNENSTYVQYNLLRAKKGDNVHAETRSCSVARQEGVGARELRGVIDEGERWQTLREGCWGDGGLV
jgi:hypothetical protein